MDGTIYGEAKNPGPPTGDMLTVVVSNPGGLRQKEDILLGFGPGISALAETQLSQTTFKTCSGILRRSGRALNREVRLHGRDLPALNDGQELQSCLTFRLLPWMRPLQHCDSGRVLLTRHWVNNLPITLGTFYGYAQGPTWPKAKQLSDQLLETFTQELILGMTGVRLVAGDFNQEPGHLTQHQIWQRHGWRNAHQVAAELFGHQPVATCKGVSECDQLWLSPEAIQLLRGLRLHDDFVDHTTPIMCMSNHGPDLHNFLGHRWICLNLAKIPLGFCGNGPKVLRMQFFTMPRLTR
eukprot:s2451_g3.t1